MKKLFFNNQAFTLLEILLVLAILGLVSSLFYAAYFDSTQTWSFNKDRIETQRAQDLTQQWLAQYMRRADVGTIDDSLSEEITFDLLNGDTVRYYLDNNDNLTVELNSSNVRKMSDVNFNYIYFFHINDNGVHHLRTKADIYNSDGENYTFSNYFYPRVQSN
jgi:prepilin-type N-terminal cleavage/methylation domain-containing protein